jgi:hypothetical protein
MGGEVALGLVAVVGVAAMMGAVFLTRYRGNFEPPMQQLTVPKSKAGA